MFLSFDYSFPRYIGRLEMCVFRNWNVAQAAIGHKIFLCPWLGCVQTFPSEQCISGLPIVPIFFCKIYLFLVKLIYFQTSPKAQRTVCWGLSCPLEKSLA